MSTITWRNETRKLGDLIAWPRNPRQIKGDQAKRLKQSFDEFGQVEPIAIGPANEVYNGHQRLNVLMAAHGAGHVVEVRVSSRPLTEKEREKLTVFLHKGAAGEWNFDTLANEFEFDELLEWGFTEKELGFSPEPKGEDAGAQVDKADELRQKWGVELGQMWKLGEHRLICGDCTDRAVVERVMGGEKAELLMTSPPYGVGKEYETGGVAEWQTLITGCFTAAQNASPLWFVNLANKRTGNNGYEINTFGIMSNEFEQMGYKLIGLRIWAKDPAWAGQNPYWRQTYKPVDDFEFLGLFGCDKPKHKDRLTDEKNKEWGYRGVWNVQSVRSNSLHSAGYPVEIPYRAIEMLTDLGGLVYEPFGGSGTTLIACEQSGRKCRAVEISPAYCAVAIQRWVDMTGGTPELIE